MGAMANIDIDLQELLAVIDTMQADGYTLTELDSLDDLDARAILLSRLTGLGWITPTERQAARDSFDKGDGQRLLAILGGQQVV